MKEDAYGVVVVVGGGAAGLSAALVLGRARRRVAVIDAGAPRNAPATHMHGFLSRDGMPPAGLLAEGRDEVAGYGVELSPLNAVLMRLAVGGAPAGGMNPFHRQGWTGLGLFGLPGRASQTAGRRTGRAGRGIGPA